MFTPSSLLRESSDKVSFKIKTEVDNLLIRFCWIYLEQVTKFHIKRRGRQ